MVACRVHRTREVIWVIDRVPLGVSGMSLCVLESVLAAKQQREGDVGKKQRVVPAEGGCDVEDRPEMRNSFRCLALGLVYFPEGTMQFTEPKFLAILRDGVDHT